jgi:hypothetical protein
MGARELRGTFRDHYLRAKLLGLRVRSSREVQA